MPAGISPYHDVSEQNKTVILKFRNDLTLEGLTKGTIKTYTTMLINLSRSLNNTPFKQITKEQMQGFFTQTELKPGSQETMKRKGLGHREGNRTTEAGCRVERD